VANLDAVVVDMDRAGLVVATEGCTAADAVAVAFVMGVVFG